ncbi:MAG: hypothetical protein ACYCZY_03650 [Lacisediminihabitans sp.]
MMHEIGDPDAQILAVLATTLAPDDVRPDDDPWIDALPVVLEQNRDDAGVAVDSLDRVGGHGVGLPFESPEPAAVPQGLLSDEDSDGGTSRTPGQASTSSAASQFPTAGHLASWAGVHPGSDESAGRIKQFLGLDGNSLPMVTGKA